MRLVLNICIALSVSGGLLALPAFAQSSADFPNAKAPPPLYASDGKGGTHIPNWYVQNVPGRSVWSISKSPKPSDPHLIQINKVDTGAYTIDSFFDEFLTEVGLSNVKRTRAVEAESFKAVFGPMVAVVIGEARVSGEPVKFFADLHGPDQGRISATVVYSSEDIFNSWDGILVHLVRNGYIVNPQAFNNRTVMTTGTDRQLADFYVGMINRKIVSDFGASMSLTEMANRTMRNAAVIAGCGMSDECEVVYDSDGVARESYP